MTRFYRFLLSLISILLILSLIYAVAISYAMLETLKLFVSKYVNYSRFPLVDYIIAAIIPTLFLVFSQVVIIANLLKRAVERGIKFTLTNILQVIGFFYLVTTIALVIQVSIVFLSQGNEPWAIFTAMGSVEGFGWISFPLVWLFLYLYLVRRFKLTGPLLEETTFEFEDKR